MKTKQLKTMLVLFIASIFCSMNAQAQTLTVKGRVTDSSYSPVIGASLVIKGTNNGTVTDINGMYSLRANKGDILVVSYIGYATQEVKIEKSEHNFQLIEELQILEECVVIGYESPTSRRMITGAVSSIADASYSSEVLYMASPHPQLYNSANTEEYNSIRENRFHKVTDEPLSTFSIDVDAASYSNMRRYINTGKFPETDAIRTEELINYFSYNYPQPKGNDPVSISTEVGKCPWNEKHRLVRIGLKAKEIADDKLPSSNLVFLIDVSGSMWGPTRLDLVKSSLKLLVNNLRDKDQVSIVVYAGAAGEVLPVTSGSDKQKIREAIDNLTAGGSTAGGAGIQLAYKIAEKNFIKGGNNRIILCTDGDFNVGVSSPGELERMIEEKRKTGVFLTILGYGMGNYKDNRMQILAEKGNGNYAYIDNLQEANKVLVTEFGGTLYTVAKDVKLQIEFNPEHVQAYRLVGYESRLLNNEDFNDDTKDAGEMGAGHTVTAFYEVVPAGVESNWMGSVDKLKYQTPENKPKQTVNSSPELLTVKLRYKQPDGNTSKKIEVPLIDKKTNNVSSDFRFAASVAMYGQLLRKSDFKGDATYDKVISLAETALDNDSQGYRREFIRLVNTVKNMPE